MATIQVRDVPEEVADELRHRAEASGRSLQSYMRDQLIQIVQRKDKAAVLATIGLIASSDPAPGATIEEIVGELRELRGE